MSERSTLAPRIKSFLGCVQLYVPLNFITLHYIYYLSVCMVAALVFWGSSTPAQSISFTDSLFLVVSAMTQAGLNTVNLSEINTWQQIILFLLMLVGSAILISCAVVHTRKAAFEKRFATVIERERRRRKFLKSSASFSRSISRRRMPAGDAPVLHPDGFLVQDGSSHSPFYLGASAEMGGAAEDRQSCELRTLPDDAASHRDEDGTLKENHSDAGTNECDRIEKQSPPSSPNAVPHVTFAESQHENDHSPRRYHAFSAAVWQDHPRFHLRSRHTPWRASIDEHESGEAHRVSTSSTTPEVRRSTSKYFDSDGTIGRNSQFSSLSKSERESLGGVEYRAVVLLERIIVIYFVLFQLLGCIGLGAWIAYNDPSTTLTNGLNPWWTGIFLGVSAFNNNGMDLLDANMVAFQSSVYVLMTAGFLILAGNTCYPVFLRFILWSLFKLIPETEYLSEYRKTLRFLLDHPRRCYTSLFPSSHTWWLVGSLFVLNGIDWAAFEILNINNGSIYLSPDAPKVLNGLFQAFAVRSGGFYVAPIANLRIGLLVLYVLMMYISVYPVTITIRNSNVYEERSLGIYADDPETEDGTTRGKSWIPIWLSAFGRPYQEGSRSYFVRQQLRGQIAHDLWWICLAVLFITISETQSFGRDPVTFAVFNIIFETVSAYGCVGISTGAPGVNYSFCGEWHVLSKLILCAVMIRGRHRGLPVTIDRAVLLPCENLEEAEEEDAAARREYTHERKIAKSRKSGDLRPGTGTGTA